MTGSVHTFYKQNGSILTYEIEGHKVFRREGGAEVRVEQLEHSGLPLLFFNGHKHILALILIHS